MSTQATLPPETPAEAKSGGGVVLQRLVMPRLLDLFCCAGGAGEGYRRSGFDVTGVDIEAQPNNPHRFIQGDALEYLEARGHEYDAIHASPPCQGYSNLKAMHPGKEYPMLIEPVRELLKRIGKPYVIENVPGAPLQEYSDRRLRAVICYEFGNHSKTNLRQLPR